MPAYQKIAKTGLIYEIKVISDSGAEEVQTFMIKDPAKAAAIFTEAARTFEENKVAIGTPDTNRIVYTEDPVIVSKRPPKP